MRTTSFWIIFDLRMELLEQEKARNSVEIEKEILLPETIVQPKYFHSVTNSIGSLFNVSGDKRFESTLPKSKDFDFFTLKDKQNSAQ